MRLGSGAFPAPPGGSLWAQALPRALFQQAIAQESMTDFEFACWIIEFHVCFLVLFDPFSRTLRFEFDFFRQSRKEAFAGDRTGHV